MDRKLLLNLYPLNLLSPQALDEISEKVKIEEYEKEDYVYRLWEESDDLRYLIEGKIQIIDASGTKHPVFSHQDEQALKPFTHEVIDIEAAVAHSPVKILRLDLELFSAKYLESAGKKFDIDAFVRPKRSDETTTSSTSNDIEPLDLPDVDDEIILLPSKKKNFAKDSKKTANNEVANHAKLQSSTVGHKSIVQEELESRVKMLENLLAKLKSELNRERELAKQPAQPTKVKGAEPGKKSATGQKSKNKPAGNLVQKLKHELTVKRGLDMKPISPVADSELERPVEIQEQKLVSEIDRYLNAMELYKQEKWTSAQAAFEDLTNAYPTTNLYSVYATRCSEMISKDKH